MKILLLWKPWGFDRGCVAEGELCVRSNRFLHIFIANVIFFGGGRGRLPPYLYLYLVAAFSKKTDLSYRRSKNNERIEYARNWARGRRISLKPRLFRFTAQYLEYCLFLKRSGDLIYEGYQTVRDGKSCRRINLIETSLRNQSVAPREVDPPLGRRRRNVSATADTAGGYVNQTVLEAV